MKRPSVLCTSVTRSPSRGVSTPAATRSTIASMKARSRRSIWKGRSSITAVVMVQAGDHGVARRRPRPRRAKEPYQHDVISVYRTARDRQRRDGLETLRRARSPARFICSHRCRRAVCAPRLSASIASLVDTVPPSDWHIWGRLHGHRDHDAPASRSKQVLESLEETSALKALCARVAAPCHSNRK